MAGWEQASNKSIIVACRTCSRPGSMPCDNMTGLNLRLVAAQYSRASMFTLRWSRPSWQMSACVHAAAACEPMQHANAPGCHHTVALCSSCLIPCICRPCSSRQQLAHITSTI